MRRLPLCVLGSRSNQFSFNFANVGIDAGGAALDSPQNVLAEFEDDISTAKELAVCEKDPELKNLMTSAHSSFMALGYNIPSVLEKQLALKSLGNSLDSREVEAGASKIGTCRLTLLKILVLCAYEEDVMLTKYIFGKRANENTEIEEAVGVAQASVPIFNSVLTSLTINSLPQEIEDEVLDMVCIASVDSDDMGLARRALGTANAAKKKQGKTIMAHFVASKVGKHLLKEFGDRFAAMAKDTVQRDGLTSI